MSAEWKNLTNGSFKGFNFHVALPSGDQIQGISSEEISLERRLQVIKRPLVDGAKVNDYGRDAEQYTAEIHFHGENWLEQFRQFRAVLDQGMPGTLILPTKEEAVQAYFQKMTRTADASGGNHLVVRCTWIEHNEQADTGTAQKANLSAAKADLDGKIDTALGILQNNPLLSAVRAMESGISVARQAANTVLTLTEGVRNRIKQLDANIQGTLSLVKEATDEIVSIFQSGVNSAAINPFANDTGSAASGAVATTSATGYDPETGQRIADFTEPDVPPPPPSPIAKPAIAPDVSVSTRSLDTDSGIKMFSSSAMAQMKADAAELVDHASGRTDDVSQAVTDVINSLQDVVSTVTLQGATLVVVPLEMSLAEVLFQNGISLDRLMEFYQKNSFLSDPMVVPAGSVITL